MPPDPKSELDPAAQVAEDLRAQLRRLQPEELLEMAVRLVTTYVLEGVSPLARAQQEAALAEDAAGDETFAGLLRRLKAERKDDPVLERFHVDGENISVRLEGFGLVPLTAYRRAQPPPAPGQPARPSVPIPRDSIYNRGLYDPPSQDLSRDARPAGSGPRAAPAPGAGQPPPPRPGATPPAAPAQGAAQKPGQQQQGTAADRFKAIELD